MDFWMSLNSNQGVIQSFAAAIQALSAVATLIATIVLVRITYKYVLLTSVLAEAAQEQMQLLREETISRRYQLISVMKTLRSWLYSLPSKSDDFNKISDVLSLNNDDLFSLQRLAAEVDLPSSQKASSAITALRWLQERVDRHKSGDMIQSDIEQWESKCSQALNKLDEVHAAVSFYLNSIQEKQTKTRLNKAK